MRSRANFYSIQLATGDRVPARLERVKCEANPIPLEQGQAHHERFSADKSFVISKSTAHDERVLRGYSERKRLSGEFGVEIRDNSDEL